MPSKLCASLVLLVLLPATALAAPAGVGTQWHEETIALTAPAPTVDEMPDGTVRDATGALHFDHHAHGPHCVHDHGEKHDHA